MLTFDIEDLLCNSASLLFTQSTYLYSFEEEACQGQWLLPSASRKWWACGELDEESIGCTIRWLISSMEVSAYPGCKRVACYRPCSSWERHTCRTWSDSQRSYEQADKRLELWSSLTSSSTWRFGRTWGSRCPALWSRRVTRSRQRRSALVWHNQLWSTEVPRRSQSTCHLCSRQASCQWWFREVDSSLDRALGRTSSDWSACWQRWV